MEELSKAKVVAGDHYVGREGKATQPNENNMIKFYPSDYPKDNMPYEIELNRQYIMYI